MMRRLYYDLLVKLFIWSGNRIYDFRVTRSVDQRVTSIHFAESEREINIAFRSFVEELDAYYDKRNTTSAED